MDPVRLYDFNHFLRDLDERLASLPEPAALENPKALHEFLHNRKKKKCYTSSIWFSFKTKGVFRLFTNR